MKRTNPAAPHRLGQAELRVGSVAGRSAVLRSRATSPLRLLTPRSQAREVLAFTSSYGGGFVPGDETRLQVQIDSGARCFLSTQASTKIYRNPAALPCSHRLDATVGEDALLIVAPDAVQCFAESRYEQTQRFDLAAAANLVLVDWMSGGRTERGERWNFHRYLSRNTVHRDGQLLVLDPVLFDAALGPIDCRYRVGRFNCFASVMVLGPALVSHARDVLAAVAASPIAPQADTIIAASPLHEGVLVRLAGTGIEQVARQIQHHLGFIGKLLDDDPWSRKW